ncbi:hypothetical protein N431DRAFT_336887 [Stipitochalara longipes BDJ]|nr:hypothetical protein N431DRAFT_336887 [Stipitochalara longipes BDJ]
MSPRISLYAILLVVFWLPSITYGQVPCSIAECGDAIGLLGPSPNLVCYVDPNDPSFFATEFYFCPCEDNYELGGFVIYEGLDSVTSTALSPNSMTLGPSLQVYAITQTYNVALTTIMPDTPIEVGYSFENLGVAEINTYTIAQSQSIFYTGLTSTFTSTVDAETTITQTATEIDETVLPAATVTLPCTTGTQTFTAKTSTTTVFTTSTPVARTINKITISTLTTTLSCIPPATSSAKVHRSPREEAAAAFKRAQVVAYEMPRCANTAASYITIVTSTTVSTSLTTSIDTFTTAVTTTISTATQPQPVTACRNVKGSTTVTPTKTKTSTVKLARSTVSSITSEVVTKTVVPRGIGICTTSGSGGITAAPVVTLKIS